MIKLSIIVPVYNVEQYVYKCINSLLQQNVSLNEYEIIVVDDGSSDHSISIIREYFQVDNLRIIVKENGGLSSARNKGLEYAVGEYLWFVDSDDWIEINCLKSLFSKLDGKLDVLAMRQFIPEGDWNGISYYMNNGVAKTGLELCAKEHLTAAQFYICRRSFLSENDLSFFEGIYHEDSDFTPRMLYLAQNLSFYEQPIYHYLKRKGSITAAVNPKRCYDYFVVIERSLHFMQKKVAEKDRKQFSNIIANYGFELLKLANSMDDSVLKDIKSFFIKHKQIFDYMKDSYRLPTRIYGYLVCCIGVKRAFSLYKILSVIRYRK